MKGCLDSCRTWRVMLLCVKFSTNFSRLIIEKIPIFRPMQNIPQGPNIINCALEQSTYDRYMRVTVCL